MDRYFPPNPIKCRREPAEYQRQSNPQDLAGDAGFTGTAGCASAVGAELLDGAERRNSPPRELAPPILPMPNLDTLEGQSINSLQQRTVLHKPSEEMDQDRPNTTIENTSLHHIGDTELDLG